MKSNTQPRRWPAIFALIAIGALAGCSSNTKDNTVTPTPAQDGRPTLRAGEASPLKIALLTPGDVNDQGWNQLAYEGLQNVEKSLGAQTSHQVTKNPADQQPALRDYGDQKFDLVICHGFEYGERVKQIAPQYPDTKFVVVGGNVRQEPNVATIVPKLEDATYLIGMAAGGLSKSGVIGQIGGMKLPVITSTFQAFELGARAVNPKIRVLTSYVGDFENQNAAKEAAKAMLSQRADILFHNADQAGKGMFVAAQGAKNVLAFGSNRNQNSVAPQVILASAVIEMPRAFEQLARDVRDKKFKAEFRELNLANGNIGVEWNAALKNRVPVALLQKIEAAQKRIESGALKIKRNV